MKNLILKALPYLSFFVGQTILMHEAWNQLAMNRYHSSDFSMPIFISGLVILSMVNIGLLILKFKAEMKFKLYLPMLFGILFLAAWISFFMLNEGFGLPVLEPIAEHSDGRLLLLEYTFPCLLMLVNAELLALGLIALSSRMHWIFRFGSLPIAICSLWGMVFWMDVSHGLVM